jgi:hypothetical protein
MTPVAISIHLLATHSIPEYQCRARSLSTGSQILDSRLMHMKTVEVSEISVAMVAPVEQFLASLVTFQGSFPRISMQMGGQK